MFVKPTPFEELRSLKLAGRAMNRSGAGRQPGAGSLQRRASKRMATSVQIAAAALHFQ